MVFFVFRFTFTNIRVRFTLRNKLHKSKTRKQMMHLWLQIWRSQAQPLNTLNCTVSQQWLNATSGGAAEVDLHTPITMPFCHSSLFYKNKNTSHPELAPSYTQHQTKTMRQANKKVVIILCTVPTLFKYEISLSGFLDYTRLQISF